MASNQLLGILGAAIALTTFFCNITGRIVGTSRAYALLTLSASACLAASSVRPLNIGVLAMQGVFAGFAVWSLVVRRGVATP